MTTENTVNLPNTGTPMVVYSIERFHIKSFLLGQNPACLEIIPEFHLKDITHIPLTYEWLWGLGAEINYNSYIYDRFKLIWKDAYKYWYVVDRESLTYLTKIEFVHEWQNFVYAMNSEVLKLRSEIKKPSRKPNQEGN